MKRWGFKGQPATHGTSLSHRSPGSIGQRKTPGRVWKGKKMAGHMGGQHVTVHNVRVLKVDKVQNLLYIRGTIPGERGSCTVVNDALFKRQTQFDPYNSPPPFPTRTPEEIASLPDVEEMPQIGTDPIKKRLNLS
jgi:large subunit ribosomal protein L3